MSSSLRIEKGGASTTVHCIFFSFWCLGKPVAAAGCRLEDLGWDDIGTSHHPTTGLAENSSKPV